MVFKLVVICGIVIFIVNFKGAEALEATGEGVCTAKISSMETRKKSYSVVVWRNGKRRLLRKWRNQSYLTWTNHTFCCQGWQHNGETDRCTPVCSTGCLNGQCIAPSTCQCEPPLYLDPERFNSCLTPVCDPPCFNSICNTNNICNCENNTRRYNKTHCAFCDEHYNIEVDLTCSPICERQCVNSKCTAPDTCSCLDGYKPNDSDTCVPLCDKCINSTCVAPNVCTCYEGYSAVDKSTCAPKCEDCSNGVCIAPGQCECYDGYSYQNGTCEATCELECVNGFCSKPNECTCDAGFVMKEPGVCSKPCRPECNGTCDLEGLCTVGVCYLPKIWGSTEPINYNVNGRVTSN